MYQKNYCIKKIVGTEFNNIKFFIFPFTTSSCVARVPCVRTQKRKKTIANA